MDKSKTGEDTTATSGSSVTGNAEGPRLRARRLTRRALLHGIGVTSAATALTVRPLAATPEVAITQSPASPSSRPPVALESRETLTAAESDTLEAVVARLIPSDENGPGAGEARAAHYIDRALTGPLASFRSAYTAGLAALDVYAQASKGALFVNLEAKDQDAILSDLEKNIATGFTPDAATFFRLLRTHTIEGTFCDPYYGGNLNFVGWDLIGYPGVRTVVSADEQRMGIDLEPNHQSAYDHPMFSKKRGGHDH